MVEDNRRSVRYEKIKMRKHHAILGLKHCGDGDTHDAMKALFIFSCHQSTAGVAR